jgi:hypothetical protein
MSFTRVEQNGVEFYTLNATGESGMSIRGLARLCNVNDKTVAQLLRDSVRGKAPSKQLEVLKNKEIYCGVKAHRGAKIIRAEVCALIICYYAFESRNPTPEARYAFQKFCIMGMERWIQSITGWKQPEIAAELTPELLDRFLAEYHPEGTIAITANPTSILNILQNSNFSAAGYRIFLYLELQRWLDKTPEIDQICKDLTINRATLIHWIPKITQWSQCADEIQLQTRQGTEFDIQRRMQAELGGRMEVYTPAGRIDLVTDTEVIEIKRIAAWKDAFGEVLAKGITFPKHHKRIHLFGPSDKRLDMIKTYCETLNVNVSFEPIAI